MMFGGIVYGLVGLVPAVAIFWKFMLTLVLFNLTTASVVLWLSIAFANVNVASLVGTLIMLFKYVTFGVLLLMLLANHPSQSFVHWPFDQSREYNACLPVVAYYFVLPCRF